MPLGRWAFQTLEVLRRAETRTGLEATALAGRRERVGEEVQQRMHTRRQATNPVNWRAVV